MVSFVSRSWSVNRTELGTVYSHWGLFSTKKAGSAYSPDSHSLEFGLDNVYALLYIYIYMHVSTLQTLADPTRLHIVEVLRGGERSVNDIVDNVDIDQSGVSRHLRILQQAGFVRARPEGQKRFYSLCPEPFRDLDAWLNQYRQLWEGRLDKFGEALARKREARQFATQRRTSSRGKAS